MKITIEIDTQSFNRESVLDEMTERLDNAGILDDSTLIQAYVSSILGSNMEFDNTGLSIVKIDEEK